jgi:hypothetical protein
MLRSLLTSLAQCLCKPARGLGGRLDGSNEVRITVRPMDAAQENIEHLADVLRLLRARGMTQAQIGQAILRALETENAGSTPAPPRT